MVRFICSRQLPINKFFTAGVDIKIQCTLPTAHVHHWCVTFLGKWFETTHTGYFILLRVYSFLTAPASYHQFSGFRQHTFPYFLPNSSLSQNSRSSSQSPHLVFLSLLPVPTARRCNGIPWLTVSFPIFNTSWQWEKGITQTSSTPFPYVRSSTPNE